jgi:Lysyl oxidase
MDGGERHGATIRLRIAAVGFVALLAAMGAWLVVSSSPATAGSGGTGDSLLPDLIVEPPEDILLQGTPKKTFLRFSHTTSNVGQGPLEIYPDLDDEDCQDRGDRALVAYQTIYQDANDSGTFQRGVDTETTQSPVGCMIFHDIHNHYHFEDFALYELYRMTSGKLKETSDKVSFCVVDILNTHPEIPGAGAPYYEFANCLTDSGIHGISVGYADIYGTGTPGQEFDVSDRNPGRYCLVARTDPADRLDEVPTGGEDNNVQTVQIRLNPKNASKFGSPVDQLDEPCSPPAL